MGKAGGREMMAGSDLDLMFVYDHPADGDREPRGARAPSQPMVHPSSAELHRGTHCARARGPDVRARHAAAAIRK